MGRHDSAPDSGIVVIRPVRARLNVVAVRGFRLVEVSRPRLRGLRCGTLRRRMEHAGLIEKPEGTHRFRVDFHAPPPSIDKVHPIEQ